jgi:dTDP-4-dehydrorhamnose reductase
VSSDAISKYNLLNITKEVYGKDIKINPYDDFVLDRSLNSDKFKEVTGYKSPDWKTMIIEMHDHVMHNDCYKDKTFRKYLK